MLPTLSSPTIHKLQDHSTPCVFLGYPSTHRGCICYDLSISKIILSQHIIFDETNYPFKNLHTSPPKYDLLTSDPYPSVWFPLQSTPTPKTNPVPSVPTVATTSDSQATPTSPNITQISPLHNPTTTTKQHLPATTPTLYPITYSRHTRPPPTVHQTNTTPITHPTSTTKMSHPTRTMKTRSMSGISKPQQPLNLQTSTTISLLPKNPIEALHNPDWKSAILDEFRALIDNKTWELVPQNPGMNIFNSMWIFRHKTRSDGSLEW